MLGERSTRDIAIATDAQGFFPNKQSAQDGGKVAGDARTALEKKTGKRVSLRIQLPRPKGSAEANAGTVAQERPPRSSQPNGSKNRRKAELTKGELHDVR